MRNLPNDKAALITLEGVDCSGKTEIFKRISDYFLEYESQLLKRTVFVSGYNNTPSSNELLNYAKKYKLDLYTKSLVYAAAHRELDTKILTPAFCTEKMVIFDNYYNYKNLNNYEADYSGFESFTYKELLPYSPSLTIWFDVDANNIEDRLRKRNEKEYILNGQLAAPAFEDQQIESDKIVARAYAKTFTNDSNHVRVDTSNKTENEVFREVWMILHDFSKFQSGFAFQKRFMDDIQA